MLKILPIDTVWAYKRNEYTHATRDKDVHS